MGPKNNRNKALRAKKRRVQRSAELPRTSDCVICPKPADRSQACTNCIPNGRDLFPYCSRACRELDVIHDLFCGSIFSIDKKRPSEDHYLAAFFPCDTDIPEVFWMHATYEDGCLEIQHDRPNMLEYIREFGESSLCYRVAAKSRSQPNTFVAVTGEGDADKTDRIPRDRKWINRSRLAFDWPGHLKHEFYPTLLYAVERNEQDEIISLADLSMKSLHFVVASWCSAENQSVLPTWFGAMEESVPALLIKPWFGQQADLGIKAPCSLVKCLRDRPDTTFPLALPFQIGLPWYIRQPSSHCTPAFKLIEGMPDEPDDAKVMYQVMGYLEYTLMLVNDEEIGGQKKKAIGMRWAPLWPSAVLINGAGVPIQLSHMLAVGWYIHSTDSPTEDGLRDFYLERWSKQPQSMPSTTPWDTDTDKDKTVPWRQDQADVDFWLALARGTSLVPDLMAKMEDPFVPQLTLAPEAQGAEALLAQRMAAEALLHLSQKGTGRGPQTEAEATDEDAEGQRPETEAKDEAAHQPQSDTESETLRGSSDGTPSSDNESGKGQRMTDGDAERRGQETVKDGGKRR